MYARNRFSARLLGGCVSFAPLQTLIQGLARYCWDLDIMPAEIQDQGCEKLHQMNRGLRRSLTPHLSSAAINMEERKSRLRHMKLCSLSLSMADLINCLHCRRLSPLLLPSLCSPLCKHFGRHHRHHHAGVKLGKAAADEWKKRRLRSYTGVG